ncbi:HNH endonuclease [Gordonia hydrophobica]|uniref:HNH endonuclease n=1 Tax=Gordonia hydrophobica TaxID=40516 RepID=A0ABZ2TYE1_9ACTN|nr:HNH endonuclease [Gordonia hydrophobica]
MKISATTPDHAEFAMEDGLWDVRKSDAFKNIGPGDDVFFWLGGGKPNGGLKGWGRVESGLHAITPEMRHARWNDVETGGYTHRFTFESLSSEPRWDPAWSEIEALLGKRLAPPAPANPLYHPKHVQLVRGLYIPGSVKGTDLMFGTADNPSPVDDIEPYRATSGTDSREVVKRAIAVRQGQLAFRNSLLKAYHEECAVTRFDAANALEAAHIDPYRGAENHHIQNGILLRSDVHTLFDLHEITIDDQYSVAVAPSLLTTQYGNLEGRSIELPDQEDQRPSQEALARHRADCGWYSQK